MMKGSAAGAMSQQPWSYNKGIIKAVCATLDGLCIPSRVSVGRLLVKVKVSVEAVRRG